MIMLNSIQYQYNYFYGDPLENRKNGDAVNNNVEAGVSVSLRGLGLPFGHILRTTLNWILAFFLINFVMGSLIFIFLVIHLSTVVFVMAWEISIMLMQKWTAPVFEFISALLVYAIEEFSIKSRYLARYCVSS